MASAVEGLLEGSPLDPLPEGPEAVAERLVAAAHVAADWDTWGGARAVRYWAALTERVKASCYEGEGLGSWWEAMCRRMGVGPPARAEDRDLLARALAAPAGDDVLDVLHDRAEALVLRVRVANDQRRATRKTKTETSQEDLFNG